MDFLAKFPKVENHTAALILFVTWYLTATVTTIIAEGISTQLLVVLGWIFVCVLAFMTLVFGIAWKMKRTDLVDMAWGPAFIVAALSSFAINDEGAGVGFNVQTIVSLLVIAWAARLAFVIFKRLRSHPEDKRYVELRKGWKGNVFINTYVRIFVVQALLATVISAAVIHVNLSPPIEPNWVVYAGVVVWIIGFIFEALGDLQLKRFLADPQNKGKLMTKGLWAYTRHPNYFGEATMWWGIFVIGLATPYGWVGILTPILITYLLLFISGVPMTEKAFEGKPGWTAYKKRTSKFLPLPPNKG